jgi:hypothetical protein
MLVLLNDKYNPFRARPRAAPRRVFPASRHLEPFGRDIALVIQRIEVLSDGVASRIADSLGFFNPDFHRVEFTPSRRVIQYRGS